MTVRTLPLEWDIAQRFVDQLLARKQVVAVSGKGDLEYSVPRLTSLAKFGVIEKIHVSCLSVESEQANPLVQLIDRGWSIRAEDWHQNSVKTCTYGRAVNDVYYINLTAIGQTLESRREFFNAALESVQLAHDISLDEMLRQYLKQQPRKYSNAHLERQKKELYT